MKRLRISMGRQWLVLACYFVAFVDGSESVECQTGWGRNGETKMQVISPDRINDGYCDCPMDGADEPNTDACSGAAVGGWTGISASTNKIPTYQCPQQKGLKIPYSRFNDGICDCCDGSDEPAGVCQDNCDEVLAAERALRAKMAKEFHIGHDKRQQDVKAFQDKVAETKESVKSVEKDLEQASEQVAKIIEELDQYRHEYMQQRLAKVTEVAAKVANTSDNKDDLGIGGLFEAMSDDEVSMFIIHSCQMAGEMEDANNEDQTCVPLRLAGIDLALLWSNEHFDENTVTLTRLQPVVREEGKLLAGIMLYNAEHDNVRDKKYWDEDSAHDRSRNGRKRNRSKHTKKGRRRLEEVHDSDEMGYPSGDEYYDDDVTEEDYVEDNEADEDESAVVSDSEDEPKEPDMLETLKDSLFSRSRVSFVRRSQEIMKGIDQLLKVDEKGDEEDQDQDATTKEKNPIDPVAFNMVKSELGRREDAIQRGFDYAVSAQILLNALNEDDGSGKGSVNKELRSLAMGTVLFGKLSTTHVWQIIQAVLPEFNEVLQQQTENDEKTCSSFPWVASCPPRSVKRSVEKKEIAIPQPRILQAAELLCSQLLITEDQAEACNADVQNDLPTSIPEGYYGYASVKPRDDADPFSIVAVEWNSPIDVKTKSAIEELEGKEEKAREEQKELEQKLDDLRDLLEGAENSRYGIDGELYALKDACYDVQAGKYTYEVCVFGGAQQKEGNAKSGTSLGKWNKAEFDDEAGKRVLKWDRGQKCWNGPERSATVFVTCGAETKILSADEPDTCRYVLEMESYIACDDAFKEVHDL